MNAKNKYLVFVTMVLFLTVVGFRYYQYIQIGNYTIEVNAVCDSSKEECFITNSESTEELGFDASPYKKVTILARYAPKCLEELNCEVFTCEGVSDGCEITYCSEDSLSDGEKCVEQKQENMSTTTQNSASTTKP